MTDSNELYTSLLEQRDAILFTHRWIQGAPDEEAENNGDLQACLVVRGVQFEGGVSSYAQKFLDDAVSRLHLWEYMKASVRRDLWKQRYPMYRGISDPVCVFWNDRYGTEEKVLAVLDEAMRTVKDLP